jgi:hypothetical protein
LQEGSSYAQISRSEITLHLNSASTWPNGGAGLLIRMRGLDCAPPRADGVIGVHAPSEVTFTPWDSRVFHVVDPFGNGIQLWENNPPGAAKPVERQLGWRELGGVARPAGKTSNPVLEIFRECNHYLNSVAKR